MKNKYLTLMEKIAKGYEYEEVQTLIENTPTGIKKKVVKTKKHMPPNYKAIEYMLKVEKINANRKNKNR